MKGDRIFLTMYRFKEWTRKFLWVALITELLTLAVALLAFQVNVSQIVRILIIPVAVFSVLYLIMMIFLFATWAFGRVFGTIVGIAVLVGLAYVYVRFLGRPLADIGDMMKPYFEFLKK